MYVPLQNIKNVKSPINNTNGVLFFIHNGKLNSFRKMPEVLLTEEDAKKLINYDNTIVILDNLNRIIGVFDKSLNKIYSIQNLDIRISEEDDNSLKFYQKTKPRTYGYVDLNKVLFKTSMTSIGLIKKDGKHIFDISETLIRLYSSGNSFKWTFKFMSIKNDPSFEFERFLGVAHNKVFILTKRCHLIVLNLLDGNLIKVLENNVTFLSHDAFMHEENKNIYTLSDYFVKFDTNRLKVESIKKIVEEKSKQNPMPVLYGIKNSSLQGKYISFTSFTKERFGYAKWIGLYDYTKEELVWHYELLSSEGQLSIPVYEYPKVVGEKIYILDTEDTLHILEKE